MKSDKYECTIRSYSSAEAAACTGFSVRQLDYWAKQGLVTPTVESGRGRGTCRRYSVEDITRLRFVERLKQSGLSSQKVRGVLSSLHAVISDPNPLRYAFCIHEPGRLIAIFKTDQGRSILIEGLQAGGQQVLEIVLETLAEETKRELAQKK